MDINIIVAITEWWNMTVEMYFVEPKFAWFESNINVFLNLGLSWWLLSIGLDNGDKTLLEPTVSTNDFWRELVPLVDTRILYLNWYYSFC